MKIQFLNNYLSRAACFMLMLGLSATAIGQDSTAEETPVPVKVKPVKNTFNSVWIIDNQTVMVPVKKTFEMDIQHRFGTVEKGYDDFWGLFAPSNIRIGVSYAPINRLNIGIGITKSNMLWDASVKYGIIQQTKGIYPVSVTYYGNVARNTTKDEDNIFKYDTYRWSFFNQLIIARKISDRLSLQLAPSVSHQNYVYGYYKRVDSATKVVDTPLVTTSSFSSLTKLSASNNCLKTVEATGLWKNWEHSQGFIICLQRTGYSRLNADTRIYPMT